jgi:hypothetical protein
VVWRLLCRRRKCRQFVDVAPIVVNDDGRLEIRRDFLEALDRFFALTIRSWFVFGRGLGSCATTSLSDEQWKRIEPHLPTDVRGVERADDRQVRRGRAVIGL